jgi:outer membrane protein OmpA-like peptidoglycan-associated protein
VSARELAALLALIATASACAGKQVTFDQTVEMQRRVESMLSSGGYSCAPRELALARANVEFARVELQQGEPSRAAEHLAEADLQARAAEQLSAATRCVPNPARQPAPATDAPDADRDGFSDAEDTCPSEPEDRDGHLDMDGCPDTDNDGDRVPDSADRCPDQPEDTDGADGDGCPRASSDRDGDGVEDSLDACPDVAGSLASKGCLRGKYRGVDVTDEALRLSEPVAFEGETERLLPESHALLDTVAQVLTDNPNMTLEVQGHTDSRGEPESNLRLSQARAETVTKYLQGRGVAAARLTAKGYGETRPIESNRTSQGRAINRRVELVRTDGGRQ